MLDIIFLLDESLSMSKQRSAYIKGINTFLSTQKRINPNANLTIVKFNSIVTTLCVDSKMYTVPEFTEEHYRPDGVTSLYDAIGYIIDLKHTHKVKMTVMFILTDGDDNDSSKYTLQSISERIKYLKQRGWIFIFIAANQNAQESGKKLGIDNCITYNETTNSIARVAEACNIAVGHVVTQWTGQKNEYIHQEIPTDVRELTEALENFGI